MGGAEKDVGEAVETRKTYFVRALWRSCRCRTLRSGLERWGVVSFVRIPGCKTWRVRVVSGVVWRSWLLELSARVAAVGLGADSFVFFDGEIRWGTCRRRRMVPLAQLCRC